MNDTRNRNVQNRKEDGLFDMMMPPFFVVVVIFKSSESNVLELNRLEYMCVHKEEEK